MKILLIYPSAQHRKKIRRQSFSPHLALYVLKGLTPTQHEVKIVEEEVERLNIDEECDLVGISCLTENATRAYKLALSFKKRGRTVVFGGVHPSIRSEETLQYGDCVVIGEAENIWERLLNDFENGNLQRTYYQPLPPLENYIPKDFSLIKKKRLLRYHPIQATRGCPVRCEYCCVTELYGEKIRKTPVENIVKEIQESGDKKFTFLDDNLIADPAYAQELFKAIKPLNIRWTAQCSAPLLASNAELLSLAAESGCTGIYLSFEGFFKNESARLKEALEDMEELEATLHQVKKKNMLIHAKMILGFDHDTRTSFHEAVRFLQKNKIGTVTFSLLTPYPGTKTFENFKQQGRLFTQNWKYYDHNKVVFEPLHMTPYQLKNGQIKALKNFYKVSSVLRRLSHNLHSPFNFLLLNYQQMKQLKKDDKKMLSLKEELLVGFES